MMKYLGLLHQTISGLFLLDSVRNIPKADTRRRFHGELSEFYVQRQFEPQSKSPSTIRG